LAAHIQDSAKKRRKVQSLAEFLGGAFCGRRDLRLESLKRLR